MVDDRLHLVSGASCNVRQHPAGLFLYAALRMLEKCWHHLQHTSVKDSLGESSEKKEENKSTQLKFILLSKT